MYLGRVIVGHLYSLLDVLRDVSPATYTSCCMRYHICSEPPQPCCVLKGSDGFDLDFTLKINLISALRQLVTMSALSRATSLTMRSRSSSASCSCSMSCRNRDEIQRLAAKKGAPAPGLALLERSFPALGTFREKQRRKNRKDPFTEAPGAAAPLCG